jgi:hypothetical protein
MMMDKSYSSTTDAWDFMLCLNNTNYAPKFDVISSAEDNVAADAGGTKNFWKFFLDQQCSSDDDVLVVFDDDSCLIDHVALTDIYDPATKKLVVHGLSVYADAVLLDFKKWIGSINLAWRGHFMTDFPVVWWCGMLKDLRAWMIKEALNEDVSDDMSTTQFWKAYQTLFKRGGHGSEFNLILNFAANSAKWKSRYDFRIAPQKKSIGLTLHQHVAGCPFKDQIAGFRKTLLHYPNGLLTHWNDRNQTFQKARWSNTNFKKSAYKSFWKSMPALTAQEALVISDYGHSQSSNPTDSEWDSLLTQHNSSLQRWNNSGKHLSIISRYPTILNQWNKCIGVHHGTVTKKIF